MSFRVLCVILTAAVSAIAAAPAATAQDPVRVQLETTEGNIVLELDRRQAPKTVENFLMYVKKGHYENTVFHRVIEGFMIQGGGFEVKQGRLGTELVEKPTAKPVANEAGNGLKNVKYSIAMARKGDPDSATSQFFINTVDNPDLNRERSRDGFGYTVFGKVVEGTEVVDKIKKVATRNSVPGRVQEGAVLPLDNVPVEPVVIKSAKVLE